MSKRIFFAKIKIKSAKRAVKNQENHKRRTAAQTQGASEQNRQGCVCVCVAFLSQERKK